MNPHLQNILTIIQQDEHLSAEQKATIFKSLKDADKELETTAFKLDRTEKVKRTTAILLEETIEELELKRKAIEETNAALQKSLDDLKAAQTQLIQSEKMASLGELTAGIAHEIQNPLNFVNNFSEVSTELVDEMNDEIEKGNLEDAKQIALDLKQNLEKINHYGKRAGEIVKGMLQHSRSSSGVKEPTDINALCDEYLRLSYHGLRAKDKSFNSTMKTDFDSGIPPSVVDKIFQPFFTTKPTGQGTGLGLSLRYDIIKAHGGKLEVETKEGEGSVFILNLPSG